MSTGELDTDLMRSVVAAMPEGPLSALRESAMERFTKVGLPTAGQEDWKYTNLSEAAELINQWLASSAQTASSSAGKGSASSGATVGKIDAHWIVLHDGIVAAPLPTIEGVELSRMQESVPQVGPDDDAMTLFNNALLRDGLRLRIGKDQAIDKPIALLYVDSPSSEVNQARIEMLVEPNASVQLVEVLLSADEGRQFTNSVMELNIASGAHVDHVRIQSRHSGHTGVARVAASLAQDAQYHHNSFDFGGALTRTDLVADLDGPGADVSMNGLYLASGDQHIDNHTCVVHHVGPTRSREEYRGILAGRSQCVFNGKVIVAEGADGTDSGQSNHNLLLSDRAEIDTKPELEIYADDVKCAHGATVGQLDETALFYLRSRGIDPDAARQMITRAFAAETLRSLSVEACRTYLEALLDERLRELVGTGNE